MAFIRRHVQKAVKGMSSQFAAVFVTGPRQAGKTTMLEKTAAGAVYVTLDDPVAMQNANLEPGNFLKLYQPPVIIDEIQYAPGLFPYIKMFADKAKKKKLFYLTGSQQFRMMKNVSESLAGRVGIIQMLGLSMREIKKINFDTPFIPDKKYFLAAEKFKQEISYRNLFLHIQKGFMPALHAGKVSPQAFYSSYVKTYIERDVRDLTQVGDELKFLKFLSVAAARTGQMLNYTSIASDVGISLPTAERWVSVLCASGIAYLLQPFFNNRIKRAVKSPKLYFLDTGLAAYLSRWNSAQALESGAMSGAFFETFVIAEIIKSYYNAGISEPPLYYYRDKDKKEIDLIIEGDGVLHPLEIKKTSNPASEDIKNFSVLDNIAGIKRGSGGIICNYEKLSGISALDYSIPVSYL
ncbi:MAG: ATP-binding protein [Candidatus Goldbacteria bacterium]|nr:ATP-binding protein [Candidatus Goldiibacteriota bacterium]